MGFNAKAIIIHGMDYRETDRIIRFIIENHGKASAIVRGVRKAQSTLRGAVEPITYGNYHLNPGRNMYIISQAETIQTFSKIKESFDKLMAASFICELTDSFMEEGNPDNDSFELLISTLNVIENTDADLRKTVLYFEVQIHLIQGIFPDLTQCVQCGSTKTGKKIEIDLNLGGALCSYCSTAYSGNPPYKIESLFLLSKASNENLPEFLKTDFPKEIIADSGLIMQRFTSHYLGRELKSRGLMESTIGAGKDKV